MREYKIIVTEIIKTEVLITEETEELAIEAAKEFGTEIGTEISREISAEIVEKSDEWEE